jgi:hypothetical protein
MAVIPGTNIKIPSGPASLVNPLVSITHDPVGTLEAAQDVFPDKTKRTTGRIGPGYDMEGNYIPAHDADDPRYIGVVYDPNRPIIDTATAEDPTVVQPTTPPRGGSVYKDENGRVWQVDRDGYRLDPQGNPITTGYRVVDGEKVEPGEEADTADFDVPPNFQRVNSEGQVTSSLTYDATTNTWIQTDEDTRTPEEIAEDTARDELRAQLLGNLSEVPEERAITYQEYADAISVGLHAQADPHFARIRAQAERDYGNYVGEVQRIETDTLKATREDMARRGLFGSSAYVDASTRVASEADKLQREALERKTQFQSDLTAEELAQSTRIASAATTGAADFEARDREFWRGLLNQLSAGARAEDVLEQNEERLGAGIAGQGGQLQLGAAALDLKEELGLEALDLQGERLDLSERGLNFAESQARRNQFYQDLESITGVLSLIG